MLTCQLRGIEMLEQKALLTTLFGQPVAELSPNWEGDFQTSLMPVPPNDEQTSLHGPFPGGGDEQTSFG